MGSPALASRAVRAEGGLRERAVTGLIWVGPVFEASGYGAVSRACLLGLTRIGFPVRPVNLGPDDRRVLDPGSCAEVSRLRHTDVGPAPVGLVHATPDVFPRVRFTNVARRIGYTVFETDRIPRSWAAHARHVDEVWLPSQWNVETFAAGGIDRTRLRVFPYGVDTEFFRPLHEPVEINERRGFWFLYVFPFDWRKGFDLLLEAYCGEFRANDDVTLVLKTQSDQYAPQELERLVRETLPPALAARPDLPRLIVRAERMGLTQLRRLYHACDVYVSTERASGWGMPCMEAMAMGKPAAAIAWGPNTEFMNEHNSLMIRPTGRLVPVDERLARARPFYREHRWAEVAVDEVRRILRSAYEDRAVLARVASRGMRDVRDRYSHVNAAERMRDYLLAMTVREPTGRPAVVVRKSLGLKRLVRRARAMLHR